MLQPSITSVQALPGLMLRVFYENGEVRLFDVSPYADGTWYSELLDPGYFSAVRVSEGGVGIKWPHGQDIAPHELYELGRAERMP